MLTKRLAMRCAIDLRVTLQAQNVPNAAGIAYLHMFDMSHIPVPTNAFKTRRATAVAYGVACHTLFAVGVGTMIVAMFFGMSRSLGRVAMPWSLVTNALLLRNSLFCIRYSCRGLAVPF